MADVRLYNICKTYPNGLEAVKNFTMEIEDKEFIVFVGPSGCGKSTALRMIAGLEPITSGELYIGDKLVNGVEPKDRDIAMVFQNYALYPHMTIYNNIAFGLKVRKIPVPVLDEAGKEIYEVDAKKIKELEKYLVKLYNFRNKPKGKLSDEDMQELEKGIADAERQLEYYKNTPQKKVVYKKMPKAEIDAKVREAAEILGITDYLQKKPKEMSGGQRQRVALGRAIVRQPKVFLLDEPLSNLDAKLRTSMRAEISKLHKKIGTTFIYVTHDQVEAMTMGTRIVVMKLGVVQQIDTPSNLYNHPANKFVAGFIGTPQMNFFNCTLLKRDSEVDVEFTDAGIKFTAPSKLFKDIDEVYMNGLRPLIMGIRSEHISVEKKKTPYNAKCRVSFVEDLGIDCQVYGDLNAESADMVTESLTRVVLKAPAGTKYDEGADIDIYFDLNNAHVFDAETENTIRK